MNSNALKIITLSSFLICGIMYGSAQNTKTTSPQKKSYKLNNLETIFTEDESSNPIFGEPILRKLNSDSVIYNYTQGYDEDEGVEDEEDILYASFDNNVIHYPKVDFSNKLDTTPIPLVDSKKKQLYVHPADTYHLSSRFGPRRKRFHYGIDLGMKTGTPIYSVFDGVVRVAKRNKSYGNLVVVRHDNGLETYYAHLSKIEVECGQEVKAGEAIGLAGNTGRSRGSHLHFETRYLGAAINPEVFIDFSDEGKKLKNDTLLLTASCFKHQQRTSQYAKNARHNDSKYYRVRKGDTLGTIARRNGTTIKSLCRLNGLKTNSIIRPGQQLKLR